MVLLATDEFATSVTVAFIGIVGGAITAFIPLWWKHRQDEAQLVAAQERERKLEEALAGLQIDPPQDEDQPQEGSPMEEKIINAVKEFVNKAVAEMRQKIRDLENRVAALEQQSVSPLGIGDDPDLEGFDEESSVPRGSLEERVRADPVVQRLLNNGNWRGTAEAAIKELVCGERCLDDSRRKTATWQQVKAVVEKLRSRPR
jgi:hypothetical protein